MGRKIFRRFKEVKGDENSYQRWLDRHYNEETGEVHFNDQGNPDALPYIEQEPPTLHQQLLYKAAQTLEGRQAEVYQLYFREELTQDEIALELSIARTSVQTYIDRAVEAVTTEFNRLLAEHQSKHS